MIGIRKRAFKSHKSQVILFDFILTIQRPHVIIVMVITPKEQLEIEVPHLFVVSIEQLEHGCSGVALQIPKSAIEIKKKMLVLFQNESPIFFIP